MKKNRYITQVGGEIAAQFEGAPDSFIEGQVAKVTSPNNLGIAIVESKTVFRPSLEILKFHSPVILEDGVEICFQIWLHFHDPTTNAICKSQLIALLPPGDSAAQKVFDRYNSRYKLYQAELAARLKPIDRLERDIDAAQWLVLAGLWPNTVEQIKLAEDCSRQFEAEAYLLSGKPKCSLTRNAQALVRQLKRRVRKMDKIKLHLALRWKEYQHIQPSDLPAQIERATGILLPVTTLNSLRDWLGLRPSQQVRSGPKNK